MFPASGGLRTSIRSTKIIRFAKHGCANRPFYHIVVMEKRCPRQGPVIEQLGSYDPMVNAHGERLCAINMERISYWIGRGALISDPCAVLFGLAGFFPMHPSVYMKAWRKRRADEKKSQKEETS